MKKEIKFSAVKQEDCDKLAEVKKLCWIQTYTGIFNYQKLYGRTKQENKQRFLDKIIEKNCYPFKILFHNEIIGYFTYCLTDKFDSQAYLKNLYILSEYQGKGIGRMVFEKINSFCKRKNFKSFYCNCNPHNKGAVGFYEKMGGKIVKQDKGNKTKQEDQVTFVFNV